VEVLEKELFPLSLENVVTDYDEYMGLFSETVDVKARGEASVYYLLDHVKSIANIKKYLPAWRDLRIVIILRNPVDACFSHYQMYSQYLKHFKNQTTIMSFEDSFSAENSRLEQGYQALAHFHWFLLHDQVKYYLNHFAHVKILFFEELQIDPDTLMKDLFDFIGVDGSHVIEASNEKYNISGIPRNDPLYRFMVSDSLLRRSLKKIFGLMINQKNRRRLLNLIFSHNMQKPRMNADMRTVLEDYYRSDVLKLQELVSVDLSGWLGDKCTHR